MRITVPNQSKSWYFVYLFWGYVKLWLIHSDIFKIAQVPNIKMSNLGKSWYFKSFGLCNTVWPNHDILKICQIFWNIYGWLNSSFLEQHSGHLFWAKRRWFLGGKRQRPHQQRGRPLELVDYLGAAPALWCGKVWEINGKMVMFCQEHINIFNYFHGK